MEVIVCSVKEAFDLMKHMTENDIVVLSVVNKKTYVHDIPRKIKKRNGEELIKKADNICYQDNDFFGTLSLYGVLKEKDTIHNILFPQSESKNRTLVRNAVLTKQNMSSILVITKER
ncbi:MAG: hypothetical protein HFF36_11830 [Coprobacillus sp.]|nr:hypothetical protein [Coprobacillus sp.]